MSWFEKIKYYMKKIMGQVEGNVVGKSITERYEIVGEAYTLDNMCQHSKLI